VRPEIEALDIDDEDCCFSLFEKMHQPFLLWWGNPEQELVNKMLREDIEAAIDQIPTAFRTVLVLVEINGQSYAEAADALGLPIGTVRSRVSRVRAAMPRSSRRRRCGRGWRGRESGSIQASGSARPSRTISI
jgi:RNA polymerase sigma-70 factor, ECF subfamily